MKNEPHIMIGLRQGWKDPQPFGISPADHRYHMYIIGKTGSGKTTLLRNLLIQHIALGHGVGLIDPHGDLAEDILNCIPSWRAHHLAYFNPGDLEHPIGMNLLANVPKDDRHLVASGIVNACKSIWHDSWGPRLEYILYNAIAALLECENSSLLGVNRLLTDESYRAWVIRQHHPAFAPRNAPIAPTTEATIPPISIHIALSVGDPVKNLDTSELKELVALSPKTISAMPPPSRARETILFIMLFK